MERIVDSTPVSQGPPSSTGRLSSNKALTWPALVGEMRPEGLALGAARGFPTAAIKSLAIFGSYARKEQGPKSDLDLMVEFHSRVGSEFIELADELEEILGMKVDLVSRKGVKERYFERIKEDLIYVL